MREKSEGCEVQDEFIGKSLKGIKNQKFFYNLLNQKKMSKKVFPRIKIMVVSKLHPKALESQMLLKHVPHQREIQTKSAVSWKQSTYTHALHNGNIQERNEPREKHQGIL